MGLWNVIGFLEKHPGKWYTSGELSNKMKTSMSTTSVSLARLRKANMVNYRFRQEGWRQHYEYTSKR